MKRSTTKLRKEARRLFLSSEMETNAEIAAHLKVKPHTVGVWRRDEGWDETRRKADKNAAARMAEAISTENVNTNLTHFKVWRVLLQQLIETLNNPDPVKVKILDRQAAIAERAQRGQRIARGLSVDGLTEEKVRADAQADYRALVDAVVEAVKEHIPDEETREKIGQAIAKMYPKPLDESGGEAA